MRRLLILLRRRFLTAVVVCIALVAILGSCREATQTTLEARTNVAFRAGIVTSFTVGTSSTSVETSPPTIESTTPWGGDGFVGSLAVVPPDGADEDGSLLVAKVVMGLRRGARECAPPAYEGCIVARRVVHYLSHKAVRLPIALWARCEGVGCDRDTTCNALGQCVQAAVDCNEDGSCASIAGDEQGVIGITGGSDDASTNNDGAPIADSASSMDASSDAQTADVFDAGSVNEAGTLGFVDCTLPFLEPKTCMRHPASMCCNHAIQGTTPFIYCADPTYEAQCMTEADTWIILRCDGDEDCDPGAKCCFDELVNRFECSPVGTSCGLRNEVCHSTGICPNGKTCKPHIYQYYRVCLPD